MAEPTVTRVRAEAHEALVLKLDALLTELRPLAVRHHASPVPAALGTLVEGLLFDARPFAPRQHREALPVAAPDYGGLVIQLGQALAVLDAFEVRHAVWSPQHAAYVWRLGRGDPAPVARLRPRLTRPPEADRRAGDRMRDAVVRRIDAKVEEAYERGLEEGRRGTPSSG